MGYKILEIADIIIHVAMKYPLGRLIVQDLDSSLFKDREVMADITIDITEKLENQFSIYSGNNFKYNRDLFRFNALSGRVDYTLSNPFSQKPSMLQVALKRKTLKTRLRSLLYGKEVFEKNIVLSYSLFWYIFQLKLMHKQKTFLHAAIFSNHKGEAIAITGTGGSGKTSTLFKILEEGDYHYLAEDFGIVDAEGRSYYNPKPISIYATDMDYNPKILGRYYHTFSLFEKLFWRIQVGILKRDPVVKSSPYRILDGKIQKRAKLKKVLYFVREDREMFDIRKLQVDELVARCRSVAIRELKSMVEVLSLFQANAPNSYPQYTLEAFHTDLSTIYHSCFNQTENYLVSIPIKATPSEIVHYLKQESIV